MCETCQNAEHNKNVSRKARPVKAESPWEVLGLDIHGECLWLTGCLGLTDRLFKASTSARRQRGRLTACHTQARERELLCLCEEVAKRPQQSSKVQPDPCDRLCSLPTHNGSCGRAFLPRIEPVMGVFLLTKVTEMHWPNDIAEQSHSCSRSDCFAGLGF